MFGEQFYPTPEPLARKMANMIENMSDVKIILDPSAGKGEFVEIQGTGESRPFSRKDHDILLELALDGIGQISALQFEHLSAQLRQHLE